MAKLTSCKTCKKEVAKSAKSCPGCGEKLKGGILGKIFILGGGGFVGLIILAALVSPKDQKRQSSSSSVSTTNPTTSMSAKPMAAKPVEEKQVINTKVGEIIKAYESNEIAADNKYKDKWVKATGLVDSIKKDMMDNLYVTVGTGKQYELRQVQAFFEDEYNNQLATLKKGQRITIECRIEGLVMNVLAKECALK